MGGNYWVLEVVLVLVSLAVGIVGTSLYYRFRRQQSASVREIPPSSKEVPVGDAYEELRSLVEGYVVEKREVTRESLLNLLAAAERRHGETLSGSQTLISIMQDVLLSIEQSKFVDLVQKKRYAALLQETIASFRQAEEEEAKRRAAKSAARRRTARTRRRRTTAQPVAAPEVTASSGEAVEGGGEEPAVPPEE